MNNFIFQDQYKSWLRQSRILIYRISKEILSQTNMDLEGCLILELFLSLIKSIDDQRAGFDAVHIFPDDKEKLDTYISKFIEMLKLWLFIQLKIDTSLRFHHFSKDISAHLEPVGFLAPDSCQWQQDSRLFKGAMDRALKRFHSQDASHLFWDIDRTSSLSPNALDEFRLNQACTLAANGQYASAYQLFLDMTEPSIKKNTRFMAFIHLAEFCRSLNHYDVALGYCNTAIGLADTSNSLAWSKKGEIYWSLRQWDNAYMCAKQALAIDSLDLNAIETEIKSLCELGRFHELKYVRERLEHLYKDHPESDGLLEKIANIYCTEQNFKEACRCFKPYLQTHPSDWRAMYFYGMSFYELRETTKATDCFQETIHIIEAMGDCLDDDVKLLYYTMSSYYVSEFDQALSYFRMFSEELRNEGKSQILASLLKTDYYVDQKYYPKFWEIKNASFTQSFTVTLANLECLRNDLYNEFEYDLVHASRLMRNLLIECYLFQMEVNYKNYRLRDALDACVQALYWDSCLPEALRAEEELLREIRLHEDDF